MGEAVLVGEGLSSPGDKVPPNPGYGPASGSWFLVESYVFSELSNDHRIES